MSLNWTGNFLSLWTQEGEALTEDSYFLRIRKMLRDCLRGVLGLMEDLFISTCADSENVSFSRGLVAKLVLTLFEIRIQARLLSAS